MDTQDSNALQLVQRIDALEDDWLGAKSTTRRQAIAAMYAVPLVDVHDIAADPNRLLIAPHSGGWSVAAYAPADPSWWTAAACERRVKHLRELVDIQIFEATLLDTAKTLVRYAQAARPAPGMTVANVETIAETVLRFWWEQESAAGLDLEGARMLLALTGDRALTEYAIRALPELS